MMMTRPRRGGRQPPLALAEAERAAVARMILEDYRGFLAAGDAADAKAFTARHAAGKAALADLDQLLKLGTGAPPGEDEADAAAAGLAGYLNAARAAMAAAERGEAEADGDGDG